MTAMFSGRMSRGSATADPMSAEDLLFLLKNHDEAEALIERIRAERTEAEEKIALVAPAEEIPTLHAEAERLAEQARTVMAEAHEQAGNLRTQAQAELNAARSEAATIREQAAADAAAERRTAAQDREDARTEAERRSAELNAQEQALAARERALAETLAQASTLAAQLASLQTGT